MHVAAVLLFDARPLRAPHGGLDMERIRDYLGSRLHLHPALSPTARAHPARWAPVWVDDARFNLFYHVRHTALPPPGEERQLKRLCGRILSQKLDVTKPLWEFWVVEGLTDDRFALVAKSHHAMVDGVAGMDLLAATLSPTPDNSFEAAPAWQPRPSPPRCSCCSATSHDAAPEWLALARQVPCVASNPWPALASARDALTGIVEYLTPGTVPASPTPLNPELGPHRRFDWVRMDVEAVKGIKRALGGTLNDVVLATVTGAVRRFLATRAHPLDGLDFRAMVPVNVRTAGERTRAREPGGELHRAVARGRARRADALPPGDGRDAEAEGVARRTGRRADRGAGRLDGHGRAHADHAAGSRTPGMEHRRDQRPRPAPPALPARGAPARSLPRGPAVQTAGCGHRAVQLRGHALSGGSTPIGTRCRICTI